MTVVMNIDQAPEFLKLYEISSGLNVALSILQAAEPAHHHHH